MSAIVTAPPNGIPSRYLRITKFITKLPGITDEQFRSHWKGHHANVAMRSAAFRKNIRKYTQVCISQSTFKM